MLRVVLVTTALGVPAAGLYYELHTSALQSRYLSDLGTRLTYAVGPGAAATTVYPGDGPYDRRLGYAQLPEFLRRLLARGYGIEAQAEVAPLVKQLTERGLYTPYLEKSSAGLRILDRRSAPLFEARFPERVFADFASIPPLIVDTLLYIENRELLAAGTPYRNPAIEWERFGRAVLDKAEQLLNPGKNAAGGSTLATQIEKFRHSPEGMTASVRDKLRQMASASVRSYLDGADTTAARRRIVLDYLNSVPLAAVPGLGEVNGLGDGLFNWFGRDFATLGTLMQEPDRYAPQVTAEQARLYREVLSLLLAQRRPSYFLGNGYPLLQALCDRYLRVLAQEGVIGPALRDAALAVRPVLREQPQALAQEPFFEHKAEHLTRAALAQLFGVPRLYDLDRMDVTVRSTVDRPLQQEVTEVLRGFADPARARSAGLVGFRLLSDQDALDRVVYSFTLYERTELGNLLRVQTDNFNQPFNINEGVKLDLGSTAKLRTLVHYLELIAEIYRDLEAKSRPELVRMEIHRRDHLTRWVRDCLLAKSRPDLRALLEAALDRRYSASPGEHFFTGGGVHTFGNFNEDDDDKVMSVRDALRDSVNLVFIRVMRDIVYHHMYKPGSVATRLEEDRGELRKEYLERFADREGQIYLRRFYHKYRGKDPDAILDLIADGTRASPYRLAVVFRTVRPHADAAELGRFLRARREGQRLSDEAIERLHEKYGPERFPLSDRGYLARIHPLELWLAAYLSEHPRADLSTTLRASADERLEVYRWLFRTRHKSAQDVRIRTLVEVEAFLEVLKAWQRVGYPFATLTPSYATAIGSSGDRPAALAELVGILVNDGVRMPLLRFDEFHFAADTPYEALVRARPARGERILPAEVAAAARGAMLGVVSDGTARRLGPAFKSLDGTIIPVGGKTGTGDHRRDIYGPGGQLIASQVVNRTATFVFMLGDRFFGTVTVYVAGSEAARYRFTSALPVQVLRLLSPQLATLFGREPSASGRSAVTAAHTAS